MTDQERELHIVHCGRMMLEAWHRWEESGCFSDRGEADHWLRLQNEAVKARSEAQVASLEDARGLAA